VIPDRLQFLVDPDSVPAQLSSLFAASGHQLFLVGGSVRDAFLGRSTGDFDFTTDARPDEILEVVRLWADAVFTVGEAFGTIAAIKGGVPVEITTFRDEIYRDDSRKPTVSYSDNVETDLSRRDFTINAIAVRLPEVEVVDPYDGLLDLARKLLKTPMSPDISFSDDPLRMLRLFRFMATLGFEPDDAALKSVVRLGERLEIVSAERIREELHPRAARANVPRHSRAP
jgi:poly(A) polymerase